MKLAVAFAVLCTASTQGFARADEAASAPNLAFIRLPGFHNDKRQAEPFTFRDLTLPSAYTLQGETPIPMEWWQQGSNSPLAIVIGNAEGTRSLDGTMTPAYYWHQDPGNGANNFGSFSFQHLSSQETLSVLDQIGSSNKRAAAAEQALPEIADQRQLVKLRRFHDLLQLQAERNGLRLTNLELINGLDLATQSELAGLDAWGYVDRLAQSKKTIADPEEQIIRARTWSYWDPVKNRWAAPGLGNTEYYIRRDQARRFHAVKQALQYQEQHSVLLQQVDLAQFSGASLADVDSELARTGEVDNSWALTLLNQSESLPGGRFNRPVLQLEVPSAGLDRLLAETADAEAVLADTIAANAAVVTENPEDIRPEDVDFKGALNRAKNQATPRLSDVEAIEVAANLERPLALEQPLALESEAEPTWERLAMTPEEFALATAIARPAPSDLELSEPELADIELSDAVASGQSSDQAEAEIQALEREQIEIALEASILSASTDSASVLADGTLTDKFFTAAEAEMASGTELAEVDSTTESSSIESGSVMAQSASAQDAPNIEGDINSSLLVVQPFIPEALQAIPLEAPAAEPTAEAIKPGQPFSKSPEIAQLAAMAHVQAAEPLINDRIESREFLDLASGLKESPIIVLDESLGLATASEENGPIVSPSSESDPISANTTSDQPATVHPLAIQSPSVPPLDTQAALVVPAAMQSTALGFAPKADDLEQDKPWLTPDNQAEIKLETSLVEPILPKDVQALLEQKPQRAEVEQPITETVLFFEENISQPESN